ncbi:MAG: hypothetical protein E7618_04625 [Ruminococcaceae bacterium]|nr:hypothetical protein [Oscillospiraceae bacterium]
MTPKKNYFDVYYQPGPNPVFCYRSGLMVYEETLANGVLVASGYNAAGYPLNVLTNCATRLNHTLFYEPSAFHLELDGQSIDYALTFVNFETVRDERGIEAILTLDSTVKPVRIKIHTCLDGTQMYTRFLEVENLSDDPMNISRMAMLSGGLETMMDRPWLTARNDVGSFYSVGYFDSDVWGREGEFAWHALQPGAMAIDTRFERERFRHPAVFLRNNLMGTMFFAQIAWSGGCRFAIDYQAAPERKNSSIAFCAELTGYAPLVVLRPKETIVTPEVYMGVVAGELDDAVNEMHAHIRRSVLNMPETDPSACLVGAGMGAEHDMSVETSKAFMRQFAEMGAEIFIIDAGWECPPAQGGIDWFGYNGVNVPNPDRYPNGMAELSDYCHSLGMKFALWVEIERLGSLSDVFKEHPEWRAHNLYDQQSGGFLDMTNPEAAAWAEEELARIITEYRMDLLRVDYNVSAREYFNLRDTGTGRKECLAFRHFNAVYKMYRNLKKRFPHVLFENCAGGGGRTDLGQMKAFHHTWVSDWQRAPRSVMITNGMTMVLPPERVDRLFAGMGCHAFGSFDLQMRNAMLGHLTLNVIAPAATEANAVQMAFVKHSVELYKSFIRPFLPTSKVYHHTPEAASDPDGNVSILELSAQDGSRGVIGVFTLTDAHAPQRLVCPRGLDLGRNYKVTLDNSGYTMTVSGYELSTRGIAVSVPASLSSELVTYEAL